jgi:BirA family biotin operon repressor/biotin-[acetyl-CoA-carboxylase] ligase
LSGQDLSDVLKISRVAVWKHIKKIKELGYTVESKQKEGYRLVSGTNLLLPWEIIQGLETKVVGNEIFYFESLGSTQDQAIKMASNPRYNGAVVIAQKQTGGRGRAGRKWISPKGGIWLSIILRPEFDISVATLFPIASSLALSKALEKCFEISPELKWPNDVTLNGKKVAGILVDASLESNQIENIVLGVGINFDVNAKEIEENLKNTPNFYGVTSLQKLKKNVTAIKLVQVFLIELENIFEMLNSGQTKKIIKEWTSRSSTIGKIVKLNTKTGKTKGKAIRIDDDGALVILDKKNTRILAGDIIHLS